MSRKPEISLPGEHPHDAIKGGRLPESGYYIVGDICLEGIGGGEVTACRYKGVRADLGEEGRAYMTMEFASRMQVKISTEREPLSSFYEPQLFPGGLCAQVPQTAEELDKGLVTSFGPDSEVAGRRVRVTRVVNEAELEVGVKRLLRATGVDERPSDAIAGHIRWKTKRRRV